MYFIFVNQVNREDQESEVGVSSAVAEGSSASSGDVDDSFDGKETDKESKKKKNRCAVCRKKVGLTGKCKKCKIQQISNLLWKLRISLTMILTYLKFSGFECRCGGLFCAVHRYSDKHDCKFDYKEMGAQEIRRNNPVVVGEKVQKI